jgi:hypothetical protein
VDVCLFQFYWASPGWTPTAALPGRLTTAGLSGILLLLLSLAFFCAVVLCVLSRLFVLVVDSVGFTFLLSVSGNAFLCKALLSWD